MLRISAPGASTATAAQMEADTGLAVPLFTNQQHTAVPGFFPFGRVMYEHGAGIDAPLGTVRMEYSSELHDAQVIVPHADWRGVYDRGTTIVGSCVVYSSNGTQLAPPPDSTPTNPDQYGGVAGGGSYGGTKEHCIDVDWPAAYTWSARQYRRGYSGPDSWMGSLIFESRDASGLYYRRNRYYDSEKGRFTQEDPIGLAGGVNLYGFVDGDPITRTDPFGLCGKPGEPPCPQERVYTASIGGTFAVGVGFNGNLGFAFGSQGFRLYANAGMSVGVAITASRAQITAESGTLSNYDSKNGYYLFSGAGSPSVATPVVGVTKINAENTPGACAHGQCPPFSTKVHTSGGGASVGPGMGISYNFTDVQASSSVAPWVVAPDPAGYYCAKTGCPETREKERN